MRLSKNKVGILHIQVSQKIFYCKLHKKENITSPFKMKERERS